MRQHSRYAIGTGLLLAMATPALQALMANQTPNDAQGELQGILTSVGAMAMIISPLLMTGVFAAATAPGGPIYLPGAPFLAACVLAALSLLLFWPMGRTVASGTTP